VTALAAPPAAAAPAPKVPRPLESTDGVLVAAGKAPELDLLYTGDVIGFIEDCGCRMNPAGGLSRRHGCSTRSRKNYPTTPLVILDGGNYTDNPTEQGEARTAVLLEQMAKLGTKVVNVGDRELNFGYEEYAKTIAGVPMDFISSNIIKQGTTEPVFKPYAIVDAKGTSGKPVRIGVLGLIRYSPVWLKSGPAGESLVTAPLADALAQYLPEVRQKSDVVVLLASISKEDARELATRFQDLDMILGSYGGMYNTVEENEGRVRIVYTGNQGKRVGESRITLDSKRRVADVVTHMHFLTVRYPEDKAMAALVAGAKEKIGGADQAGAAPAGGH
jgi:2',3'-cyclic-nucleotide 2'-phosphodiesterase (5'-nucleotidase family)